MYRGIYTFGYIVADESPYVCFSKVYELDETSAENFAFYDSASVTVSGNFGRAEGDSVAQLQSLESKGKPNCFGMDEVGYAGIPGKSYTMNATFKWDSAGHKVTSKMKAETNIPTKIHAKGVIPPSVKDDAAFVKNDYSYLPFEFLGFPNDVKTYKIPMEYDESVRGVLMTMSYDKMEGGESMNTTINNMLGSFLDPDSTGYGGVSTKKPEESTASMGFMTRMMVAGRNSLDTMEYPGMTVPVGKSTIYFYATDQAYSDYENTVLDAISDPRVVPKSNVENGMGVFSGMLKDSLLLEVTTDKYVTFEYMGEENCFRSGGMSDHKPFETKWCRLNRRKLCVFEDYGWSNLRMARDNFDCISMFERVLIEYEPEVEKWEDYPNRYARTLDDENEKNKVLANRDAYNAEALLFYCMDSNFVSNSVASCDSLRKECQESLEKTDCKESLWEWCSDRDWNISEYPQCGTALVSRYYLEEIQSPILKRVVDNWCKEHPKDAQCKR
ncbi:hypothetical protein [Fibrobacter sp. HC4]|uniref:hypothetical protein n=1 Tax=Fibrobacter sp. HC4 TaxID=3239812 RepID=UPI002019A6ED|nr:hypothetical protein [Fibrobacter succinogenes]